MNFQKMNQQITLLTPVYRREGFTLFFLSQMKNLKLVVMWLFILFRENMTSFLILNKTEKII